MKNTEYGYYESKKKLADYLYKLDYKTLDYQFAYDYYKNNEGNVLGGCTSFRAGHYFGRNYDWLYDNSASFVVTTPKTYNRHKVIGISGNIKELTNQFVESDEYSKLYKLVPFSLLDGINDCGLVVSMNVVPTDYGINTYYPDIGLRHFICSMMIPRFLLDRFSNTVSAISYLKHYCSIYPPKKLTELGYELHFIISDAYGNTVVIELINNKLNILKQRAITNFHLSNVKFNDDGKVYTPATQTKFRNADSVNGITKYGCGLERFNLVKSLKCSSKNNVRQLLKDLYYSNTYKNLNWFTEFVGNDLTVTSSVKDYVKALIPIIDELEYKDRETSKLWQTVHSSLYDIPHKTLELCVQENSNEIFSFSL